MDLIKFLHDSGDEKASSFLLTTTFRSTLDILPLTDLTLGFRVTDDVEEFRTSTSSGDSRRDFFPDNWLYQTSHT
ncbi:hypothetical protein Agabi119p4_11042 [Agaricus bisporus var. burnettii]|uniref:Uncharacterized protein n=1 Tax=Agaricus bisporus var. burnettii TaxID=192524 RepID=A0A8H7C134_AGABI|nr:hypothetical protein Agabi119p4_11042 [Agaricus bisporus var. burnettii]